MVEREVETTVSIQKWREVPETYLDEEKIVQTYAICDACGEACDERGGRHRMIDAQDVDVASEVKDLRGEIADGIIDTFIDSSNSGDSPTVAVPLDERIVTEIRIQAIVNEVTSEWDEYDSIEEGHAYDFCDECRKALDDGSRTLDTAAYETVDDPVVPNSEKPTRQLIGEWVLSERDRVELAIAAIYATGMILAISSVAWITPFLSRAVASLVGGVGGVLMLLALGLIGVLAAIEWCYEEEEDQRPNAS